MSNISFSSGYGEFVSGEFNSQASFELLSNGAPIYNREIDSKKSDIVILSENMIFLGEHNFVTGEELKYTFDTDIGNQPIKIASTVISGITTNILPETLFAVKINNFNIQFAPTKEDSLLLEPNVLNLTQLGTGIHIIASVNQNKNNLITLNNVIQNPIIATASTSIILEPLVDGDFSVSVKTPELFKGGDLVKINDEILRVTAVGIGTTNSLEFNRELLGTFQQEHPQNSVITVIKGNYNIVNNILYFTRPPYGDLFDSASGLRTRSTFSGRVFLRSGNPGTSEGPYDTNYIFDDISTQFTGIGSSFTLTSNGENISGFSTDNAVIIINDVFQFETVGLLQNAYELSESSGISTITFTGNNISNNYDVNINELPRGGILFSVGSTQGLGYQPLISAGGTATVSAAGTIQSISVGYSGSGYREGLQTVNVSVALSNTTGISQEIVGIASILNGNITNVTITNPGTGYTSTNLPEVVFDAPLSYFDIPLIYSSSSSGIGTFASIDITVGQGSSVIDFNLNRLGYGFAPGEVLTVAIGGTIGIPTDSSIPFREFQILVDDVYFDNFSGWSLGQLISIDPISNLFDGRRKVFPIKINGEQTAILSRVGSNLDVQNNLLVFIDNILQVPGEAYFFDGGSIIQFSQPPSSGSIGKILFYAGTANIDTKFTEIIQTIKSGDTLQISDNQDRLFDQNPRIVNDIISADLVKTNLYSGQGILDSDEIRPVKWCLQTDDKYILGSISGELIVTKDRKIYEPAIYPTTFIINPIEESDTEIFVDNVKTFFDNDKEPITKRDIFIISQDETRTAKVGAAISSGVIQSLTIIDSGVGYSTVPTVRVSKPTGIGTTALISSTINVNGELDSLIITNSGSNYTSIPQIIVESPKQKFESIDDVNFEGDFGVIVGIATTSNGVIFDLFIPINSFIRNSDINSNVTNISGISTGYYFNVINSNIGENIESLRIDDSVIGISSSFSDNVYQVSEYSIKQKNIPGIGSTQINEVIVKVTNNSSLVGFATTSYYGDFSWGRIYNLVRTNPQEFFSYVPGINTSSIITRRNPLKFFNYS